MVKILDGRVRTESLIDTILPANARGRAKMADTFIVTGKIDAGDVTDAKLDSLFQMGRNTTVPETAIGVTFPTAYADTPVVVAVPGPGNTWARVISADKVSFLWQGSAGPPPGTASWLAWGHRT